MSVVKQILLINKISKSNKLKNKFYYIYINGSR